MMTKLFCYILLIIVVNYELTCCSFNLIEYIKYNKCNNYELNQNNCVSQVCVWGGILVKVTLTFGRRAHHCRLVSMATVTSDERPAPALAQTVLITTATQALVVEEARA